LKTRFLTNLDSLVKVKGAKNSEPLVEGNPSATSIFSKFSSLKTTAFPSVDLSNQAPIFTITINQRAGDVSNLSFYNGSEDSKYYLTVKDNPTLFEVNSSTFEVFKKDYKELIK